MLGRAAGRIAQGHPLQIAQLDVARAVAKRLLHPEAKASAIELADMTVETIASPGMQFDPQQARCRTFLQLQRIIGGRQAGKAQQVGLRGLGKTGRTFKQARPGIALGIHRAHQDERQLSEELLVLLGHGRTDDFGAEGFHALGHPSLDLQLPFAGMPR